MLIVDSPITLHQHNHTDLLYRVQFYNFAYNVLKFIYAPCVYYLLCIRAQWKGSDQTCIVLPGLHPILLYQFLYLHLFVVVVVALALFLHNFKVSWDGVQ